MFRGPKGRKGVNGTNGTNGTNGVNGVNGSSVLTTNGAPSAGTGVNGDFAYDPTAKIMYGPKAGGSWPAGISLQGSPGAANISATTGKILKATSSTAGGDSLMSETGSVMTINGKLIVNGDLEMIAASGGGWADMEGPVNIITVGPSIPVITALPAPYATFSKPLWQIDDTWQAEFHIPHGVDPTAGIFPHVHALVGGIQTRDLKMEFTYSIGKGYKRGVMTAPATISGTLAAPGVAMEYMILEVGPVLASSPDYETDSILTVRFTRRTNGGSDITDNVYIDRCDCHIRMLAPHLSIGRNYPFNVAP